jgi:hypothetical protein
MKKAKRLLSLLLSAAMVASMVPLTAHAAEKHSMKIAYVTPSEGLQAAIDGGFYDLDVAEQLGIDDRATALDAVKANYDLANAAATNPQYGTEEDPIEVNVGETFYLSFDLNYAEPDKGGFIGGVAGIIEAPEGVLTSGSSFLNPGLLGISSGRWAYTEEGKNYYPGKTAFAVEASAAQPGKNESNPGGKTDRFAVSFKNGSGYIPNAATWDAIVSFTANKTGTYEIKVPTDTAENNSNMQPGAAYGSTTSNQLGWDASGNLNNPNADSSVLLGSFEANSIWISVADPSEGPSGSESDYADSVDNKKNAPYYSLTQDDTVDMNEEWIAHTDFLTFPENETTFVPTDTVVVYADNNGELGEEIGRTVIDGNNLYKKNEEGVYQLQGTTGTVAGYSLPLIPEKGKLGDGYITGETAVWIGRLEAGEGKGVSEKKVRILVTPEEPIFYNGNVSVLEEGVPGSTAENPIKVHVGDKLSDVLASLKDVVLPTAVDAPVEGAGKTVNTQLASQWSELVPDGVKNGVFTQHGSAALVNPYQDTTASVSVPPIGEGEAQQVTLSYKQPLYENGKAIEPFGACIYIEVVPNPSDYFVVNKESETVTILGETQKYMTAGDTVKFYTGETGGEAIGTVTITEEVTYNPNTGGSLPKVGEYVYVSYTNTGKSESLRVPVVVTDGTAEVNGNVDLGTIKIGTSATAEAVLKELSPVTFNIANATEPWQQQFTMDAEKINGTDATLKATTVPEGSPIDDTTTALELLNNPEKKAGTIFELAYTIPTSENNDLQTVTYRNSAKAQVLVKMEVLEEIPLEGDYTIAVTENNPLGTDDTITITGDTSGKLATAVAAGRAQIAIFAEDGTMVGVAENSDITPEDKSGTWDYTVKVSQTARDKGTELQLYTAYVGGAYLKQKNFTVDVDEKYSYQKAIQPASLTILKDDILNYLDDTNADAPKPESYEVADVEKYIAAKLGNDAAIEYAYLMSHPTVGVNNYVPDPAATYTKEATGLTWSAPSEVTEYESEAGFTATAEFALTGLKSSTADGAKDNLDIVVEDKDGTSVTFTRTVKVVTDKYTEEDTPKPSEIAAAITVTNNAYPAVDEIKVTTPDTVTAETPVIVTVYKDEAKKDKLGAIELTTGGEEKTMTFDATADQYTGLDSMGGNVYFTVHTKNLAPSDPLAVKYDVEPYMLWEPAEISPDALSIHKNDAGTLEAVTERLPKTMDAKVVHLQGKGNGVYEPKVDESRNVPVNVGTWKVGSRNLELADITAITEQIGEYGSGPATEKTLVVNTAYDSGAATLQKVIVTSNAGAQNEVEIKSSLNGPNGTIVTPPTGFDTADVTITFTNDPKKVKTELPDPCNITVNSGKTPNDANPGNDTVEIDITDDDSAALKESGVVILEYTAPDGTIKTYTSKPGDLASGKLQITVTEGGFEGFDLSAGTFDVYFQETDKERSDSIQVKLPEVQLAIKIADDVTVQTISMAAGSMDEAALTDMVNKVTSVDNVLMDSGEKITLDLVNADGTIWTMQTGSASTSWTDKQAGEWTDVLAVVPEAGTEVRLIAHFDTASYDGADIVNDDPERLAIIKINLTKEYDPEDPSTAEGALVLTEGNSDIYNHLKPESDSTGEEKNLAQKALDRKNAATESSETYKNYRSDLVFYYKLDAYQESQNSLYDGGVTVEQYVNPWVTADGTKGEAADYSRMLGTIDGTDAAEWLAAHPEATVEVKEIVVGDDGYGSSRAQLYDVEVAVGTDGSESVTEQHIQPQHSLTLTDYFDSGKSVSSTVRGEEYYKIMYVVTYTNTDTGITEVYTAARDVTLRYRAGDTNLDIAIDGSDSANILARVVAKFTPFRDADGVIIDSLQTSLLDINGDIAGDGSDSANILAKVVGKYEIPDQRF